MVEKNLVPSIRFKGYTGAWEHRELLEVAKYRNGKAHESEIDETGNYIVVNSKFVSTDGTVKKFTNTLIEPLYKGELAFVLSDVPNGKAIARTFLVYENNKYSLNQRIAGITPLTETDSYYLSVLMNRNKYFLSFDDGAKQTNLSKSDVEKFESLYPTHDEQSRIGSMFENMDNFITLHQRKYDKLQNVKKALLEKMFPKEGEITPEIRFKGFTDTWEQRKVEDFATFQKGKGLSWNDITADGKQKCILYGNLYTDYGMIAEDAIYKTNTQLTNAVKSKFGDVLIPASDTTPTGLARATSIEKEGVLLGGDINVIRPNDGINGSCLSLVLNANRQELIKLIKGTTVKHIYNSDIKDIYISLPKSNEEQEDLVSLFKNIDSIITLYQRNYEKLLNIKKALLEKMFI